MIGEVIGHIKESNGNKYLVFDSTEFHSSDENEKALKIQRTLGRD